MLLKYVVTLKDGTQKIYLSNSEAEVDVYDSIVDMKDYKSHSCYEINKQFRNKYEFDQYIINTEKKYRAENTTGNEMLDAVSLFMPMDYLIKQLKKDGYVSLNDLTANYDLYQIESEATGEVYKNQLPNLTIADARKIAGITQKQMSEMFEIPLRTIENWEAENRKPPYYVKRLIIEKLIKIKNFS